MRLGKVYGAIVRGSALDARADVITLAEITRFLSRSPALRPPTEAARVALENGIAAHMRALHRDGVLCTAGSIAEDEAHEVLHELFRSLGFVAEHGMTDSRKTRRDDHDATFEAA